MKDLSQTPFQYLCANGTEFSCSKCNFKEPIIVHWKPKNDLLFAVDVAEMISYHLANIWPELNGFQGYDCIRFKEKK